MKRHHLGMIVEAGDGLVTIETSPEVPVLLIPPTMAEAGVTTSWVVTPASSCLLDQ